MKSSSVKTRLAAAAGLLIVLAGGAWLWIFRGLPAGEELRAQLLARYSARAVPSWTPIWTVSTQLQTTVVLWEDPDFPSHHGIAFREIPRAMVMDLRAGKYASGASTITQQVAKNLFLSQEKTIRRKLREAVLAWRLEDILSKEQILEIYLNIADWGEGVTGAEAAARFYFGKPASGLNWAESAMLAGLLPNPRRRQPFLDLDTAMRNRAVVLKKLLDCNEITQEEYGRAMATPWFPPAPLPQIHPAPGEPPAVHPGNAR
ncbi:MAG: transglycosylase domain-containing protein [Acidobacteriia bacterium]|nr:transglycosylase domain-containing protein [Terriglobia bacterium]